MTWGDDGGKRPWHSVFNNVSRRPSGNGGALIVLTASAPEISDYREKPNDVPNPFMAFTSAFPNRIVPRKILRNRWFHPEENPDHTAKYMPLGLRKVESILLKEFPEEDVKVVHPESLHHWVGPRTKVLGVNTMNPLGLAYVDTTYSSIIGFGGESINSAEFKHTVFHPNVLEHNPTIIVGGGGAWQIDRANMFEEFGISSIMMGECENQIIPAFKKAIAGERLPRVIKGGKPKVEDIPHIKHRSTYGLVEIMRGCGRMCQFCSPTLRKKISFPADYILEEVRRNVAEGSNMAFTVTEDLFLYDSLPGFVPNRESIVNLYRSIAEVPGIDYIQISHSSLVPAIYDEQMIEELTHILLPKTLWNRKDHPFYKDDFISVEVGIETGSTRIMKEIMPNKAKPYSIDDWPELVTQAVGIMNDHQWYPLATIMTGMPGETEDDTIATLELLDDLKGTKMFFTPLLFIPLEDCLLNKSRVVPLDHLSDLQWDFISTCWNYNVDYWFPRYIPYRITLVLGTIMVYYFYYRWKHGPRVARHAWKVAGFPEGFWPNGLVKGRVVGGCDPAMCVEEAPTDEGTASDEERRLRRNGRIGESV
jgi:radical SAM superfamily enzyme YgiQ (UPF0313 family)